MAETLEVRRATAEQAKWMREQATKCEQYAQACVAGIVGKRLAWWQSFEGVAGQYDLNVREIAGTEALALNDVADKSAERLLTLMGDLYARDVELVGREEGDRVHLAAAPKGAVPTPLEALPLLPLIVVGGFAAIVWSAVDVWMVMKTAEADAQKADAANQARKLELIKLAEARGGMAARQMAKIIETIDKAAADKQRGFVAQLKKLAQQTGQAVADVAVATKTTAEWSPVLIALLAYAAYRVAGRRRNGSANRRHDIELVEAPLRGRR